MSELGSEIHRTTTEMPAESELAGVVQDNIRTLIETRKQMKRVGSFEDKLAGLITRLAGSVKFVYVHAVFILGWVVFNSGTLGFHPFDPFPFAILSMIASVEAIFVSTFVLISQNRMARIAERHADLDLQINLLAEHEITRLIQMTDAIAKHLQVVIPSDSNYEDLKTHVKPDHVLGEIARAEHETEVKQSE